MKNFGESLKRCPCCGCEAVLYPVFINRGRLGQTQEFIVACKGCGLNTSRYGTPEDAQRAWNKRKM